MHSLKFVHRDLYWRNVLVADAPAPRRLVFIDAWRGGARLQWRKAAYDLACLFLEGPSLLSAAETRTWLAAYTNERRALGEPLEVENMFAAANAARRGLLERARREPGRWRVPEAPVQEFDFVAAAR
jgi:aminoglycoside/choline kinase family phosphotransferase